MPTIAKPLLAWFAQHGRHSLPWQADPINVYHVWLSEVMLQQTQVSTAIGYFNNFIKHFPTLTALAKADQDCVLAQWAGLGYYARARNLHACARVIVHSHQGDLPAIFEQLVALPGIGKSTAAAILSIGFNQSRAILDGNVKRVLSRYHQVSGHYGQSATLKELWRLAEYHTPNTHNAEYTQAIMDLGATLCRPSNPDCGRCPIAENCQAKKHSSQAKYPKHKPKKIKPVRRVAMLVFMNKKNQIYLQRRPNKGIWGGLWGFVECADNPTAIEQSIASFHPQATIKTNLPCFKHSFTHYHLLVHPLLVACTDVGDGFRSLSKLNIGLPQPVGKIITQLK